MHNYISSCLKCGHAYPLYGNSLILCFSGICEVAVNSLKPNDHCNTTLSGPREVTISKFPRGLHAAVLQLPCWVHFLLTQEATVMASTSKCLKMCH